MLRGRAGSCCAASFSNVLRGWQAITRHLRRRCAALNGAGSPTLLVCRRQQLLTHPLCRDQLACRRHLLSYRWATRCLTLRVCCANLLHPPLLQLLQRHLGEWQAAIDSDAVSGCKAHELCWC